MQSGTERLHARIEARRTQACQIVVLDLPVPPRNECTEMIFAMPAY
jgi:hypothetical protein